MHKPILRRVGLVLLGASLLQLAWTIARAFDTHSFFFDFTIPLAGIALLRGRLATAHFIRRCTAFGAGALILFGVYWIASEPLALVLAKLRFQTVAIVEDLVSFGATLAVYAWTARELGRPEILVDTPNDRFGWITPQLAFAGGAGFCIIFCAIFLLIGGGQAEAKAVRDAQAQLGPSFRTHLASMSMDYRDGVLHVSGTVEAWNDFTVVELPFAWDE